MVADLDLEPGLSVQFALQALQTVPLSRWPCPFPIIPQQSAPCVWLPSAQQMLFHSLSKGHLLCQVIHRGSPDYRCLRIQTHAHAHILCCSSALRPAHLFCIQLSSLRKPLQFSPLDSALVTFLAAQEHWCWEH